MDAIMQMTELLLRYHAAVDSATEAILVTSPWKSLGHSPRRRPKSP